MAREALGVVGAAVGFVYGGPAGAQIGFAIGSTVGGFIDGPDTIRAPGLSEAPIQTSRDGIPITNIWGLQYCHGNVLQKNPEEIVTTTERQGKGGGSEVETKQRFRTFAIGVCEGPQAEITRIWENNRLVYDVRATPAIDAAETTAYAENITIYLGTEDQLPDPELEAHWTTDETPAYRGMVYIVWNNYDLTDFGGAIPQFAFEVNGSRDATVTSKPYPIEAIDGLQASATPVDSMTLQPPVDGLDATVTPQIGVLRVALDTYTYETEGLDATITPQSGVLRVGLHSYSYEPEGLDATVTPRDSVLRVALIQHTYETEGLDALVTPLGGSLTTP